MESQSPVRRHEWTSYNLYILLTTIHIVNRTHQQTQCSMIMQVRCKNGAVISKKTHGRYVYWKTPGSLCIGNTWWLYVLEKTWRVCALEFAYLSILLNHTVRGGSHKDVEVNNATYASISDRGGRPEKYLCSK